MNTRSPAFALIVLVLLGGIAGLRLIASPAPDSPDITVTNLHGDPLPLARLRGQPVLINFWATSCPGCVTEIPHLSELHDEFAAQGLRIIGIAMPYDPPDRVIAFTRVNAIPYDIALDVQGKAAKAFGDVQLTPSSFLIDPEGRIVLREVGSLDADRVRASLRDMLKRADTRRQDLAAY